MKKIRLAVVCGSATGGALALAKGFEAAEEKGRLPADKIKKVDFIDPSTMKPVKPPKLRAEGTLEDVVEGMNERHFSGSDNALFAVKNPDGTSCVRFAGKGTDGSKLADGEKSLRFSADYKDEKKLISDILGFEQRGLIGRGLLGVDRDHSAALAKEKKPFDPLSWRPEGKDAKVPKAVLDARLSLLGDDDRKAVEDAVKDRTTPNFLYYYCGGRDDKASREGGEWHGAMEEGELRTIHLCAYISKSEAQAMRIFRSSGAYEAASGKPYPLAMDEAWTRVEAFRAATKEETALVPVQKNLPAVKKVYHAQKEL